jgi:hypothetical protein
LKEGFLGSGLEELGAGAAAGETEQGLQVERLGKAMGCHGCTSVLVDDEIAGLDVVTGDGLGKELLGQRRVL